VYAYDMIDKSQHFVNSWYHYGLPKGKQFKIQNGSKLDMIQILGFPELLSSLDIEDEETVGLPGAVRSRTSRLAKALKFSI